MKNFAESCLDNHRDFRVLLQAMSRPGEIFQLEEGSPGRERTLLRLLDSLLDPQVGFALFEPEPQLEEKLRQQCGVRPAPIEEADFLIAPRGSSDGQLQRAKRGRLEFPDEGATLIFAIEDLCEAGDDSSPCLSGPGIKESIRPRIVGLDRRDLQALAEINQNYPLGIDAICVDRAGKLMCIPRSTRIQGV